MQLPDKFKEYAALVSQQLRWKKARPVVEREITAHLCDQYDALVTSGMPEEAAVEESIHQMGDAVEIGAGLDRVHRPKPSWGLLALTAVLVLMGLAIKAFLTYDVDYPNELPKMLAAAVMGLVCLFAAYFIDFTVIGKWPVFFYAASILLVLYLTWNKVSVVRDSTIWPHYLTLCLPVGYAALLYWLRGKRYLGLLLSLGGLVLALACCARIPSLPSMLIVAASGIVLLAVAAWGDWFLVGKHRGLMILGVAIALCAAAAALGIWNSAYLSERLALALHPELDPAGKGWTGVMVREILSGARLLGRGDLGRYAAEVPMLISTTDWMLVYLTYRLGWVASIAVLAVFAGFFVIAIRKCVKQKNMLGRMVSLAVILTMLVQVLLYVLPSLGVIFVWSISLPLVSYGNTALIVNMALIGVMLSAFRTGSLVRDGALPARAKWDRLRWNNGELTISFKKNIAS